MTKTGQLITRNSKHVKPTQITVEQYLWDELDKYIVIDPLKYSKTNGKTNTYQPDIQPE